MKNSIGQYRGTPYKKHRICEVTALPSRRPAWFTYEIYGGDEHLTGDYFLTLDELRNWVDDQRDNS